MRRQAARLCHKEAPVELCATDPGVSWLWPYWETHETDEETKGHAHTRTGHNFTQALAPQKKQKLLLIFTTNKMQLQGLSSVGDKFTTRGVFVRARKAAAASVRFGQSNH